MSASLRARALNALARLEARQVDDAYAEHEQLAEEACVAAAATLGVATVPADWSPAAQLGVEARGVVEDGITLAYRLMGLPGHADRDAGLYLVDGDELVRITDLARLGVWLQAIDAAAATEDLIDPADCDGF